MSDFSSLPSDSKLSSEQQAIVNHPVGKSGGGLAVLAGAGSGKTTTLVMKCERFVQENPGVRIAAVSFTERSAGDLRNKLSQRIPLKSHWVMTIHGLCGAVLREYPQEAGFDGKESILSELEASQYFQKSIDHFWKSNEDVLEPELHFALNRLYQREGKENFVELIRRLKSLRSFGALDSLLKRKDPASQDLAKVYRAVDAHYENLKRRLGMIDFDDLEKGADRALNHQNVRIHYHRTFDLVLVDEFQDTNPTQARIVEKFVRPDRSNLCVVGDPKQSIYRFRDADVSVFEEFCRQLPTQLKLTRNYRSRPAIIEYSNEICQKLFQEAQLEYEPLVPQREADASGRPAVRYFTADRSENAAASDPNLPQRLADWILSEVKRGVPLESMALLVRRIRGNEKWFKALSARGIPLAIGSGGLFWEDPRVRELVALLRAWQNPAHQLSAAVFLRAPWVGVSDTDLDEWIRKKSPRGLLDCFFQAQKHSLSVELASLWSKEMRRPLVRPGEILQKLLEDAVVEEEVSTAVLGLWHRVENLSSRGLGFREVIEELSLAIEEGQRERDVPPPKNSGQLSVLTLHSSKGLEFPHVILIDFKSKTRASEPPKLYWDRENGAFLGGRDEDGERTHRKDPEEKTWKERENLKNLAESMRLFYVALTRAQESLTLVLPALDSQPPVKSGGSPFTKDHWLGWVQSTLPPVADWQPLVSYEESPSKILEAQSSVKLSLPRVKNFKTIFHRPRYGVTELNLLSQCPRRYEWSYLRPPKKLQTPPNSSILDLSPKAEDLWEEDRSSIVSSHDATEWGIQVHEVLESQELEILKTKLDQLEKLHTPPLLQASSVVRLLEKTQFKKSFREFSFETLCEGEVIVGIIDRVDFLESGLRLMDYKVTKTIKSKASLIRRYQTQMELYAWALQGLDHKRYSQNFEALWWNIHPQGVNEVRCDIPAPEKLSKKISDLIYQAKAIVQGEVGVPRPSEDCQYCVFRDQCEAGNQQFN